MANIVSKEFKEYLDSTKIDLLEEYKIIDTTNEKHMTDFYSSTNLYDVRHAKVRGWRDKDHTLAQKKPQFRTKDSWDSVLYVYMIEAKNKLHLKYKDKIVTRFIYAEKKDHPDIEYDMIFDIRTNILQRSYKRSKNNRIKKKRLEKDTLSVPKVYINGAMLVKIWKEISVNRKLTDGRRSTLELDKK